MPEFVDLLEGYRRFREGTYPRQRDRFEETAMEGQSPKTLIIGCSDSRVDPAQIFDVDPGEIFVVRNVAALVPPFETTPGLHGVSAAVEFAVQMLKVSQIMVMGHGRCGGCQAALSRDFLDSEPGQGGERTETGGKAAGNTGPVSPGSAESVAQGHPEPKTGTHREAILTDEELEMLLADDPADPTSPNDQSD